MTQPTNRAHLWALAAAGLVLAGCPDTPSGDDDQVDAAVGSDGAASRDVNVNCEPEIFTESRPDGSSITTTIYFARVEQPFRWSGVSWRTCNPMIFGGGASVTCPVGSTCTGTPRVVYPFCLSGSGLAQINGGDDVGRVHCGSVTEVRSSSGTVTKSGAYYQLAQVHIAD